MTTPARCLAALVFATVFVASEAAGQALIIRNNYDVAYDGPIELSVALPDGHYVERGDGANGLTSTSEARVRHGVARARVRLAPRSATTLVRTENERRTPPTELLNVRPFSGGVRLLTDDRAIAEVQYGLAVIPGTSAGTADAVSNFSALDLTWVERPDGSWNASALSDGYAVSLSVTPTLAGVTDFRARIMRAADTGTAGRGYLALVRRVQTPGAAAAQLRFNGRRFDGFESPDIWDRDFWYTHGVDWISWQAGGRTILAVNGFSPVPPVPRGEGWREASHFWVWEKARRVGDAQYLVSEIAGPNEHQASVTQYAPFAFGDTVTLTWRLAASEQVPPDWAEGHLAGFAGPRFVRTDASATSIDLGVRSVAFGVSYFPYSTLTENFDYYRTPGLSKEGFWAFSPVLWSRWRELVPRMRTDLHIIRAMGFERVRLHHLELLHKMDSTQALAFLDFFFGEARDLGLRVLIDSDGPSSWLTLLAERYRDSLLGFELENEVLISGIPAGGPARWKELYAAVKAVAPETEVFLTGVGNNGMYERLRLLGVPFDRVGLHAYKHGPQWKEAFASHMLGTASYASSLGMPVTLGEFNWKDLTRLSPPARLVEYTQVYEHVLGTRAIPDVFHFQFQESLSFNPSVAGTFSRHYETLRVDRRPKPEAFELMRLIRKYSAPSAPANQLLVTVSPTRFTNRSATASYSVSNTSGRLLAVSLAPLAFDGLAAAPVSATQVTLAPGETKLGTVRLQTAAGSRPGTYHHFIQASYDSGQVTGWGIASLEGAPQFEPSPVLPGQVVYPQGAASVTRLNWRKPLAVVFGGNATVLELETAYALTNTLQSATGKDVWLSAEADLPDSLAERALVIVVGTAAASELVRAKNFAMAAGKGSVIVSRGGAQERVFLTGPDKTHAQAAAVDFLLRYWKNAKDSMVRLTGMERGAALGNRIAGVVVDPP